MFELRQMTVDDVDSIVSIIAEHDEDDGEDAARSLTGNDLSNLVVLDHAGRAAGMSGVLVPIAGSDGAYWLSWTYLDKSLRGQGLGRRLVDRAIDDVRYRNGRKIFIKVSDYRDDESGDLYAPARHCYRFAGFREELAIRDYYDAAENLTVFGLDLRSASERQGVTLPIADEHPVLEIGKWFEIAETDDAYSVEWRVRPARSGIGAAVAHANQSAFSAVNLRNGLSSVRALGARAAFLSFPSNLPAILDPIASAGFQRIGSLTDYHGRAR